jgi:hypothetical protein
LTVDGPSEQTERDAARARSETDARLGTTESSMGAGNDLNRHVVDPKSENARARPRPHKARSEGRRFRRADIKQDRVGRRRFQRGDQASMLPTVVMLV